MAPPLIPRPRYDGVRRLADMILDAIFGQPLRRLQEFFRDRHVRRARREQQTARRQYLIDNQQIIEAFTSSLTAPLDRARQSLDPRGFADHFRWLADIYPDGARRYAQQMDANELDRLVDPRLPGNLRALMRAIPATVTSRVNQARKDLEAARPGWLSDQAFRLKTQMIDSWSINTFPDTFDDLNSYYLVDPNKRRRTDWRSAGSSSQHEAMDDYMRRMNPFGNRRDPIG